MVDRTIPPVPAGLARYPRGAEMWNALWANALERTRVFPALHGVIVEQYCVYYSDMRDAMEKMERGKLVAEQKRTVGEGDKAKVTIEKLGISPYQRVFDTAVSQMERLGRLIGLDPMNPLEEVHTLADYAGGLNDIGEDDEWEDVEDDDGNNGPDEPGDAGGPADGGSDPGATGTGNTSGTSGRTDGAAA